MALDRAAWGSGGGRGGGGRGGGMAKELDHVVDFVDWEGRKVCFLG